MGVLLAKQVADLTMGGAFLWYFVKYIIYLGAVICAVILGAKWRKSKNAKAEMEQKDLGKSDD